MNSVAAPIAVLDATPLDGVVTPGRLGSRRTVSVVMVPT